MKLRALLGALSIYKKEERLSLITLRYQNFLQIRRKNLGTEKVGMITFKKTPRS